MADTSYAKELASADYKGYRIERLHIKEKDQEEIRFSWWPDGKFAPRPLDLTEDELLPLLKRSIEEEVFSPGFLDDLQALLSGRRGDAKGT